MILRKGFFKFIDMPSIPYVSCSNFDPDHPGWRNTGCGFTDYFSEKYASLKCPKCGETLSLFDMIGYE